MSLLLNSHRFDTVAGTVPADPSSLTATSFSSSQIDLSWTDNSSNEVGFRIERCTGAACSSFAEIATVGVNVTSYSNTGLTISTLYRYRVRAYNGTGNSGYSNTAESTTSAGSTINVAAGGDLQAAINSALPGYTISVEAGATFTGTFTLPNKGVTSSYITIQSSALASLPAAGIRVSPSDAANMPKITSPGVNVAALQFATSASYYKLIGLEILPATSGTVVDTLLLLGYNSTSQTSLTQVPHHLTVDRCYIHPFANQALKRGIGLHSASTDILNSYISNFKLSGADSQAIWGNNAPGPYNIINNYIEGAGENMMFGGDGANIPGVIPSDILIQQNYFFKPLSWYEPDPSYDGFNWTVKNLLEFKNAQRVVVDGNIFEHAWPPDQSGYGILFTPANVDGSGTAVVQDILFTNNLVRHTGSGIDAKHTHVAPKRIQIVNNLWYDLGSAWSPSNTPRFIMFEGAGEDFELNHNTIIHDGTTLVFPLASAVNPGFIFSNNIAQHNAYGIFGEGSSSGNPTIAAYFPSSTILKNVISGANSSIYPTNNFYPALLSSVLFTNQATDNYRLQAGSPYHLAGTDGTDVGVNITTLNTAIGASSDVYSTATFKVITGDWS